MKTDDDAIQIALTAVADWADKEGPLLPVLHQVQERIGHVPDSVVPEIARALNLSRAEVHGVVTYYHHFRSEPAGRCVVQVCRAEACQSMGADALLAHARWRGVCTERNPTSADGRYTVEPVYCLGLCASSPAAMVNGVPHARLSARHLDQLMDAQA